MHFKRMRHPWLGNTIAGLIAAAIAYAGASYLPENSKIVVPYIFVAVMLLPVQFAIAVRKEFTGLKDNKDIIDGVTSSEYRRIVASTRQRAGRVFAYIIGYVLSAVIICALALFTQANGEALRVSLTIAGFLVGINLFSMLVLHYESEEVSTFIGHIQKRNNRKQRKKDALERLSAAA
ncbi:hypothetical protein [Microbulbifer agarilyticus]